MEINNNIGDYTILPENDGLRQSIAVAVLMDQSIARRYHLNGLINRHYQYILSSKISVDLDLTRSPSYAKLIEEIRVARDDLNRTIEETEDVLGQDPSLHPYKKAVDTADFIISEYERKKVDHG